jgi:hypothetical protein
VFLNILGLVTELPACPAPSPSYDREPCFALVHGLTRWLWCSAFTLSPAEG